MKVASGNRVALTGGDAKVNELPHLLHDGLILQQCLGALDLFGANTATLGIRGGDFCE